MRLTRGTANTIQQRSCLDEDERLQADYAYDALGRRLFKHTQAHYQERREAGPH